MQQTAAFYSEHFGFKTTGEVIEGLIELQATNGGAGILIHQTAKTVRLGQVGVKLSFHVQDVAALIERGVPVHARNRSGLRPIEAAQCANQLAMRDYLASKGGTAERD